MIAVLEPTVPPLLPPEAILWLCLLAGAIGVGVIWAIVWFGRYVIYREDFSFWGLLRFTAFWEKAGIRPNLPRYFVDALSEGLERRNEFWTAYGQMVVSILTIVVLTILLLTKTISAEAGVPLLSAITGFAIAKGAASSRTTSSGPEKDNER